MTRDIKKLKKTNTNTKTIKGKNIKLNNDKAKITGTIFL